MTAVAEVKRYRKQLAYPDPGDLPGNKMARQAFADAALREAAINSDRDKVVVPVNLFKEYPDFAEYVSVGSNTLLEGDRERVLKTLRELGIVVPRDVLDIAGWVMLFVQKLGFSTLNEYIEKTQATKGMYTMGLARPTSKVDMVAAEKRRMKQVKRAVETQKQDEDDVEDQENAEVVQENREAIRNDRQPFGAITDSVARNRYRNQLARINRLLGNANDDEEEMPRRLPPSNPESYPQVPLLGTGSADDENEERFTTPMRALTQRPSSSRTVSPRSYEELTRSANQLTTRVNNLVNNRETRPSTLTQIAQQIADRTPGFVRAPRALFNTVNTPGLQQGVRNAAGDFLDGVRQAIGETEFYSYNPGAGVGVRSIEAEKKTDRRRRTTQSVGATQRRLTSGGTPGTPSLNLN